MNKKKYVKPMQMTRARITDYFNKDNSSSSMISARPKPDKGQLLIKFAKDRMEQQRVRKRQDLMRRQLIFGDPRSVEQIRNSQFRRHKQEFTKITQEIGILKDRLSKAQNAEQQQRLRGNIVLEQRREREMKLRVDYLAKQFQRFKEEFNLFEMEKQCRFSREGWPLIAGRYQPLSLLGKGGFSQVYLALDTEELEEVAMKVHQFQQSFLSIKASMQSSTIRHALRQIDTQKKLVHPNVVQLFDQIQLDATTFVTILQYCDRRDLKNELKLRGCFPEADLKVLARQIFKALRYMHQQDPKVVHYDLKPQNIFLKDGLYKIADFGLCKHIKHGKAQTELTSAGCGTYYYLPPQCFSKGEQQLSISQKVDIWSIGVILYELLFNRKPYGQGMSQGDIYQSKYMTTIGRVEFPSTPLTTQGCRQFIRKCLCLRPEDRFSAGTALSDPFLAI